MAQNAATYPELLRLTSGKFETELAKREPHNRENGLKITRGVDVFLVFTKITFNNHFYHMNFKEERL